MNLDRLKALIRLANNNPSDNEANTAARRVCKILAENNFSLLNGHKTAADKMNETRASEPFGGPGDPLYDFFVRFRGNRDPFRPSERQQNWTDYAPHVNAPEPDFGPRYVRYKPDPPRRNKEEDFDWVTGKRNRKQELRVCSKCGLETMTFRTDEVPWICNPCHWKDKI